MDTFEPPPGVQAALAALPSKVGQWLGMGRLLGGVRVSWQMSRGLAVIEFAEDGTPKVGRISWDYDSRWASTTPIADWLVDACDGWFAGPPTDRAVTWLVMDLKDPGNAALCRWEEPWSLCWYEGKRGDCGFKDKGWPASYRSRKSPRFSSRD